eukprot:12929546-Prorocentrum_lima.AAC.1
MHQSSKEGFFRLVIDPFLPSTTAAVLRDARLPLIPLSMRLRDSPDLECTQCSKGLHQASHV